MEAQRRRSRVRKPLADCTNNLASSQSSSSSSLLRNKTRKPILSAAISKLLSNSDAISAPQNDAVAVIPPPVAVTPSRPTRSSSESGEGRLENLEPCSVYSRRQSGKKINCKLNPTEALLSNSVTVEKSKSKGKEIVGPLSCPPATKIRKIGEKIKEDVSNNLPKACTAVRKKKQVHRPSAKDSDLSQEYIEQQRAYYAEIDAFELSEEEVESIDELD